MDVVLRLKGRVGTVAGLDRAENLGGYLARFVLRKADKEV